MSETRDLINALQANTRALLSNSSSGGGATTGSTQAAAATGASSGAAAAAAASTGGNSQSFIGAAATNATNAAAAGFSNLAAQMGRIPGIGGTISTMTNSLSTLFGELGGHVGALGQSFGVAFGLISQAMSSITNIGMAAIDLVFAPLNALIGMAQAGGGSSQYRTEIENIRKAFGDLRQGVGGQVYQAVKNVHGALAETGLSVYRVFGNRGLVAQAVRETAEALGATISQLGGQLERQAEHVITYRKVFDLSQESMQALGARAITTGTTLEEQGRQIAQVSLGLANRFGSSARQIGRDIGEMIADVKNFGGISPEILGNISAHFRQLGLTVKNVIGVVDAFDNFESAAKNAATLAQQFGIQVDALQLMREQDPAARFETLRKAFFATGQSVETMSRQQIAAIQAATHMDETAIRLGFSLNNQSKSYAEVQKQSEASQKKQLSQAEAMEELAHSIDRMVQSGSQFEGGFFDIFFKGFTTGIMRSQEFREIMREIRQVMRIVFYDGIAIGRDFVKNFPGVAEIFGGLADIFNPDHWRTMMDSVKSLFHNFFIEIGDPATAEGAGQNLINGLKNAFSTFFDTSGSGFSKVMSGFGNFIKAIIFGGLSVLEAGIIQLRKSFSEMLTPAPGDETNMVERVMNSIRNVWAQLKGFMQDLFGRGSAGSEMMTSISNELRGLFTDVGRTLGSLFKESSIGTSFSEAVQEFINEAFPESGPSITGGLIGFATSIANEIMLGLDNAINAYLQANPDTWLARLFQAASGAGVLSKLFGAGQATTTAKAVAPPPPAAKAAQPAPETPRVTEPPEALRRPPPPRAMTTVDALEQMKNTPTARELRALQNSLPSDETLAAFRRRVDSFNAFITNNLITSLTTLRNNTSQLETVTGESGAQLKTLISNIADVFFIANQMITIISTSDVNPALVETKLSTIGITIDLLKTRMSGPTGIASSIHNLREFFKTYQVNEKLLAINTIFNNIAEGFTIILKGIDSVEYTAKSIAGLTATPVENGLIIFRNMINKVTTDLGTTGQINLVELNTAAFNAHRIAEKITSIVDSVETSSRLLSRLSPGETGQTVDPNQILVPALTALNAMIANVNLVDEQLRSLASSPINIPAQLETIAHNILGTTTNYRISTGNVNFNVNVNVTLDADELATKLVETRKVAGATATP